MKRIFECLCDQLCAGNDDVLATVVAKAGSVPRGVGSQMLVTRSGRIAGTIGGGAGEWTITGRAMELMDARQSALYTYVMRSDAAGQAQAVCGGDITAQMQFIPARDAAWLDLAQGLCRRIAQRQRGWLVLDLSGGAPALLDGEGLPVCGKGMDRALCQPFPVKTDAHFAMPISIGERAVIFGAGHCAQALVPVLASVGFRVTVYDDRASLADAAFFPNAERVICAPYDEIEAHIALDESDYVVVMSSMHAHDVVIQQQLLRRAHVYNGMLGSAAKRAFVHGKLLESGVPRSRIDAVRTPIGMSIGAVTPAEIAVSIAGEMIRARAALRKQIKENE